MDATATATRPTATVVVCTRGRGDLVRRCVDSVVSALAPSDELLVVEAETRAAHDLVEGFDDPRCRWLGAPVPGRSLQLNQGIRAAAGEVILVTDDDCVVAPGWIDAMAGVFVEDDVGMAFGPVDGLTRTPGNTPARRLAPGPAPREMWAFSHGAAMGVRRSAAVEVGGFDERLGPGAAVHGEEADMLLRIQAAGWRCWVADAPPVQHLPWRSESEDVQNLLVYERGGGAWVGAAVRRDPRAAAGAIWTRLRYQLGHFSSPSSTRFALRAQLSFGSGLAAGLRLAPRRFIDRDVGRDVSKPEAVRNGGSAGGVDPLMYLPWPAVRGRRCLSVASFETAIAAELRRRGALEVVEIGPGRLDRLLEAELGVFDIVVADGVLGCTGGSDAAMAALRSVCRPYLLSIERIDVARSVLARRRPYARRKHGGTGTGISWALNGAAHRQLLESGGFEVQLASRPWVAQGRERAGHRFPREMHRALLTRSARHGSTISEGALS